MNDTEAKQFLLEIINQAQADKYIEFQYIKNWNQFSFYCRLKKATKLIIKTLKTSANTLFKEYCKDVIAGISEVTKLLAYSELSDIIAFYERDLETLKSMLNDYEDYLYNGHFWYSILGGERDIWNIP